VQNHLPKIRALHSAIEKTLFSIEPPFSYNRLTQAISLLVRLIDDYEGETNEIWAIGSYSACSIDSLIVAAYWHYSHWHEDQSSDSYRALSALGSVFNPGMTSEPSRGDNEYDCYAALNTMVKRENGLPVYSFAEITL
jgi:hypothetical protein